MFNADRKQFLRKYKKIHEISAKTSIPSHQETLSITSAQDLMNPALGLSRTIDESELARKLNASKVKKTLSFENKSSFAMEDSNGFAANYSSFNGRKESDISNYSSFDKEKEKMVEKKLFDINLQTKPLEKEGKTLNTSFDSPRTSLSGNKECNYDLKPLQDKLIGEYGDLIINSLKEKDVIILYWQFINNVIERLHSIIQLEETQDSF